jgi:hypothetical protein
MPMAIINAFLQRPGCEVLINFMDSFIYRFCRLEDRAGCLDLLYGSEDWRDALEDGLSVEEKRDIILDTYMGNLYASGKLHFAMKGGNNCHVYHLVFATNHPRGMEVMKRSMAGASQEQDVFAFSEKYFTERTRVLINIKGQEYKSYCANKLSEMFRSEFKGQLKTGKELGEYVLYETPYLFNFKLEMKRTLIDCMCTWNKKFDEILFCFPYFPYFYGFPFWFWF